MLKPPLATTTATPPVCFTQYCGQFFEMIGKKFAYMSVVTKFNKMCRSVWKCPMFTRDDFPKFLFHNIMEWYCKVLKPPIYGESGEWKHGLQCMFHPNVNIGLNQSWEMHPKVHSHFIHLSKKDMLQSKAHLRTSQEWYEILCCHAPKVLDTRELADCPAMSFVFVCWQQINIRNTNQLSWAMNYQGTPLLLICRCWNAGFFFKKCKGTNTG